MLLPHPAANLTLYRSPLFESLGVPHAFSTRGGGVSPKPFDSLNLGLTSGLPVQDSTANILENYRRLMAAIGCEHRSRCWVHQVHGAAVCDARAGQPFENGRQADALVTDDPARLVSIKYADCVPILLSSADGRLVAAVHAGWRGIVAGVISAAVKRLTGKAGPAASLVAAIGPCIGMDHFEVGAEVLAAFKNVFGADAPVRAAGEKGFIDLPQAARQQLLQAGLLPDQIDGTDRCTFRDAGEFFSHRRDAGITGRMAAMVGIVGGWRLAVKPAFFCQLSTANRQAVSGWRLAVGGWQ